jgi:sec-independent protein translocase protein TatA
MDAPSVSEQVMFEGLLSPMHLVIILLIAIVVLGPKRLPEAGRGLGEALRGFKASVGGSSRESGPSAVAPRAEDEER